jgi:hypothetical protein
MRLSETKEAVNWLRQFDAADMALAARFLDHLMIVAPTEAETRIRSLVEGILGSQTGAVALYPVWEVAEAVSERKLETDAEGRPRTKRVEVEPAESIFPRDTPSPYEQDLIDQSLTPEEKKKRAHPPKKVPNPKRGITGSVGRMIHLITDLQKEHGSQRILDRPSLHVLRATRCRRIVLLDDLVGSGKRVTDYLVAFYRHKTIKSWGSHPGLRVTIVCHAATEAALAAIRRNKGGPGHPRPPSVEIVCDHALAPGRSFWSVAERQEVEYLCRKYAPRTGRPGLPLGYRDAFTMIVFPYAVPNTAPAILWSENGRGWRPLFPNRAVPGPLVERLEQVRRDPTGKSLEETLEHVGQLRLAKQDWSSHATPEYRRLVLLLAVVSRGFRKQARVAEIMEIPREECVRLFKAARRFGHLLPDDGLSPTGVEELRYARSVGALPWEPAPLREDRLYFPRALRGVRGSSSVRRHH